MYGSSDIARRNHGTMFKLDDMVTASKEALRAILKIADSTSGTNTNKLVNMKLEATKALLTLEEMGK